MRQMENIPVLPRELKHLVQEWLSGEPGSESIECVENTSQQYRARAIQSLTVVPWVTVIDVAGK